MRFGKDSGCRGGIGESVGNWRQRLAGAPPCLKLPSYRPRPAAESFSGAWFGVTLPEDLVTSLEVFAQSARAALFITVLDQTGGWRPDRSLREDILCCVPLSLGILPSEGFCRWLGMRH